MRVYWVLEWDYYYPNIDNWVASFETEEEAREYINRREEEENTEYGPNFEIINIEGRL